MRAVMNIYQLFGASFIASLIMLSCPLAAEVTTEKLDKMASEVQTDVVDLRRWFHEHPELSNREFETSKRIAKELQALGLEVETGIAHTGVVALLKGAKKGPTVALRADIDGLPVTEQTGLPYASKATSEFAGKKVGVMHACGHDSHIAMLLGAAKILTEVKDELAGDVLFIFQPAEEGAPSGEEGGAELMLKEGVFKKYKPDVVFGMHIGLGTKGNHIAVRPGPTMAAVDIFEIIVKGRQTHGAKPWNGVDPIVVSSQIILGLQTIASRQVNVTQAPSIITVGKITGGVRHNIIPDEVELWGTIRTFDEKMRSEIHQRIEKTASSIAESAGAKAEVVISTGYPVTVNDTELTERMLPTLKRVTQGREVITPVLKTTAEDFSFFANDVPGMLIFLGAVEEGTDPTSGPANHSPFYTVHEPNMETGVKAYVNLTVDYMEMENAK